MALKKDKFVQIRFNDTTPHGQYNDALYFTDEEYSKLTEKDIDELCQKRIDAWVEQVENPPVYVEPSKEDYLNMYQQRIEEAQQYLDEYVKKASKIELEKIESDMQKKQFELSTKIVEK